MTIETKFDEGDTVFFLHNSKVIKSTVQGFKIERLPTKDAHVTTITYLCNSEEGERVNIKVDEAIAFSTKEKLLKSL